MNINESSEKASAKVIFTRQSFVKSWVNELRNLF